MQQMAMKAIGKSSIQLRSGFKENPALKEWDVPLGTSLHFMNAKFLAQAQAAMTEFMDTFPDEHHFRRRLSTWALVYEYCHVESVRLTGINVISSHSLKTE